MWSASCMSVAKAKLLVIEKPGIAAHWLRKTLAGC